MGWGCIGVGGGVGAEGVWARIEACKNFLCGEGGVGGDGGVGGEGLGTHWRPV